MNISFSRKRPQYRLGMICPVNPYSSTATSYSIDGERKSFRIYPGRPTTLAGRIQSFGKRRVNVIRSHLEAKPSGVAMPYRCLSSNQSAYHDNRSYYTRYHEIQKDLQSYYKNWWRVAQRLGICLILVLGTVIIIYVPPIRNYFSEGVVEVTSQTLDDRVYQEAVQQVAVKVVNNLLSTDETTREAVVELIRDVIKEPTTYESLRELIVWLLRQDWIIDGTEDIAVWNTHAVKILTRY